MMQFQAFVDAPDGIQSDSWWYNIDTQKEPNEQNNTYLNHPREMTTWYQSVAFCRWLTNRYWDAGLLAPDWQIRLPTEKEWEIAARYPDSRLFPWGDSYHTGAANCDEQASGDGPYFLNQTTAVGLYETGKHSELDLYDMSGNVWEWTLTKWNKRGSGSNEINDQATRRVVRGGSFFRRVISARADFRAFVMAAEGYRACGLRLCLAPIGRRELYL